MYPISEQFKAALGYGPSFRTKATITPPGGSSTSLELLSGTVAVDSQARVRRRVSGMMIRSTAGLFDLVSTPGAVLRVWVGVKFRSASEPEWVPVFTGEVQSPKKIGGGTISLVGVDFSNWLSRTTYDTPYVVAAGTSRSTAIITALLAAKPGAPYANSSTDAGVVATQTTWTTGPLDLIADLALAGNSEAFFAPDGTFILRDLPSPQSIPVWSISAGPGGTLKSADRTRSTDRLVNRVVVEPSARDGSQTWDPQAAEITDTAHPLHKSKIGKSTRKLSSPVATRAEAQAIAQRNLANYATGNAETLSLGAIMNPALEGYDVIRANTPSDGGDPARLFQHFLDTFTIDVVAHTMTAETLSQVVTE